MLDMKYLQCSIDAAFWNHGFDYEQHILDDLVLFEYKGHCMRPHGSCITGLNSHTDGWEVDPIVSKVAK